MRRPFKLTSNPTLPEYRKEGPLKDKVLGWYKKHTRLVVLFFIIFLLVMLWWRGWQSESTVVYETVYSVVFDAGSTGSRVHAYRFDIDQNGALILRGDDFHQVQPGISAYAKDPNEAGASLDPLLSAIDGTIPLAKMSETPCQLRATAGLRLLPDEQSQAILDAVSRRLERTEYNVDNNAVSILDGNFEGAYAWLAVSYLLERLNGRSNIAAIDLGGGSVQESFERPPNSEDAGESMTSVHSDQGERQVYVHSYLNYGLMAARALILKSSGKTPDTRASIATTRTATNAFQRQIVDPDRHPNAGHIVSVDHMSRRCSMREIVRAVLNLKKPCKGPSEQCTFDGVWGGPVDRQNQQHRSIYLFSYFWDRAVDVDIVTDPDAVTWQTTPSLYATSANKICKMNLKKLRSKFPNIDLQQLPFLCMDLTYISVLLTEGFQIDPSQDVQLAKQINYK